MNRIPSLTALALATLALPACGQSNGESSTTKLTNVEVVDGSISDDMILLDTSTGDGTAVDTTATGDLYETIDNRPKSDTATISATTDKDGKSDAAKVLQAKPEPKAEPAAPSGGLPPEDPRKGGN